jgi:hypothetical protein
VTSDELEKRSTDFYQLTDGSDQAIAMNGFGSGFTTTEEMVLG